VSEMLMAKTGFALVPFSSYSTLLERSERRSQAKRQGTKTEIIAQVVEVKPGLSRRGAQRPAGVVGVRASRGSSIALPVVNTTISERQNSASFRGRSRTGSNELFACRADDVQKPAFWRQRDNGRDRGFSVPATGIPGLQNPSNHLKKDSSKNPPGRLLSHARSAILNSRSRKALEGSILGSKTYRFCTQG
jgi:hypothetical protein